MSKSSIPVLSTGERVFARTMQAAAVCVSCAHAAAYFHQQSQTQVQAAWMIATIIVLIVISQVLVNALGKAVVVGGLNFMQWVGVIACCGVVFIIEVASMDSSAEALQGRMESSRRAENHSSPEYIEAQKTINSIDEQIRSYRSRLIKVPDGQSSKFIEMQAGISALQDRRQRAVDYRDSINVSTLGGDREKMMSNSIAVMLSAGPIAVGFVLGALDGLGGLVRRRKEEGGKKQNGAAQGLRVAA